MISFPNLVAMPQDYHLREPTFIERYLGNEDFFKGKVKETKTQERKMVRAFGAKDTNQSFPPGIWQQEHSFIGKKISAPGSGFRSLRWPRDYPLGVWWRRLDICNPQTTSSIPSMLDAAHQELHDGGLSPPLGIPVSPPVLHRQREEENTVTAAQGSTPSGD